MSSRRASVCVITFDLRYMCASQIQIAPAFCHCTFRNLTPLHRELFMLKINNNIFLLACLLAAVFIYMNQVNCITSQMTLN